MKPYELKPLRWILLAATTIFMLLFLTGFPSGWTDSHTIYLYGEDQTTLTVPFRAPWFLVAGPIFLNTLAILLAAAMGASPVGLRFQLIQPVSRSTLLFRQIKQMALILAAFAVVGSFWACMGSSVPLVWGLTPLKNTLLLWAVAMFWGTLTLGITYGLRIPAVLVVPAVLVCCFVVIGTFTSHAALDLRPIYQMQFSIHGKMMEAPLSQREILQVMQESTQPHSISGDLKLLWSLLVLALVYGAALLGFKRRSLF